MKRSVLIKILLSLIIGLLVVAGCRVSGRITVFRSGEAETLDKCRYTCRPSYTANRCNNWCLQFMGVNTDREDFYTQDSDLRVGDTVYFHARLTGGAPDETIQMYYEICMNGEFIESSSFSGRSGDCSDIWVCNTPFRYGPLSVRIFYYENNGNGREINLGSTSVHIAPRQAGTLTETARGWISGCDIYFNRYGSLCFDLSNYEPQDKAIIWFARNECEISMKQGTITGGQVVWDNPVPGMIYRYAVWCGDYEYSLDVAALSEKQIPDSAWIRLYVTNDHQVYIVSSDIAVNIRQNE